jgi:hypothetical protein
VNSFIFRLKKLFRKKVDFEISLFRNCNVMIMGCTPSSHSSDQTGLAYGCARSSSATDLTQEHYDGGNRRTSLEMNGTHTGIHHNKDNRESLVRT